MKTLEEYLVEAAEVLKECTEKFTKLGECGSSWINYETRQLSFLPFTESDIYKTLLSERVREYTISAEAYNLDRTYKCVAFLQYYLDPGYLTNLYNFTTNWNEKEYHLGVRLKDYFNNSNIKSVGWRTENRQPIEKSRNDLEIFKEFFTANPKFDPKVKPEFDNYNFIINCDLSVRFLNAFEQQSKFVPGQVALVKLGRMPQRVISNMPEQVQKYIYKKSKEDLCSVGVVLDVVNNKVIEVRDKGRWYKVAIATPFCIFCVEERHLKKYNPTIDYIKELHSKYVASTNNVS